MRPGRRRKGPSACGARGDRTHDRRIMSRFGTVRLVSNYALYQGFVRRSVRLVLARIGQYREVVGRILGFSTCPNRAAVVADPTFGRPFRDHQPDSAV